MTDLRKCLAEAIGTFWLTFGGCGTAVIAAGFPQVGVGLVGVALAFGLTLLTMAYAIGHISGCHINPAVTVGLAAGGRFPKKEIAPYVIAQVIGAIIAAGVLYLIAVAKALAWTLRAARRPRCGTRAHHDVPVRHHGRDAWQSAGRLRADRNRFLPDTFISSGCLAQLWLF